MIYAAYLHSDGLSDVGYRKWRGSTPTSARITAGITGVGAGYYEADIAPLAQGERLVWDSPSAQVNAVEYYQTLVDVSPTQIRAGVIDLFEAIAIETASPVAELVGFDPSQSSLQTLSKGVGIFRSGLVQVNFNSPQQNDIPIVPGDDYYYVDSINRALEWQIDTWPDLTGATIKMVVGTLFVADGKAIGPRRVRVELSSAQTSLIPKRRPHHSYSVQALLPVFGHVVTLVKGSIDPQ